MYAPFNIITKYSLNPKKYEKLEADLTDKWRNITEIMPVVDNRYECVTFYFKKYNN